MNPPAPGATPTRERILAATTSLLSRQGYNGTGLKQIVADAAAPFGSIYHFFPGGKEQLGAEVIAASGALYLDLIDHYFAGQADLVAATRTFFDDAAATLEAMDFADPCPIATISMEVASTNETLRLATAAAFESWIERAAHHFTQAGIAPARARAIATALLAALEGGFMLGRALRDPTPVRLAGDHAVAALTLQRDDR
jgi:AcrR family transcriptional regulator